MPNEPNAFLSYTRIDDDFFGGAITSLRKSLEMGVRVVTGDRSFCIFQDVDGVELGQTWQGRLDQAVSQATFLIPVLTPCFFQSNPCRDELGKFLQREKQLRRNDLILPIYYVTTPVLDKQDPSRPDPIADEINKRQRYDWREKADLPFNDPQVKKSVRELAEKIASAITRTNATVKNDPVEEERRDSAFVHLTETVSRKAGFVEKFERRLVLWVDDRPENNVVERQSFSEYGVDFVLAHSTEEALTKLADNNFDAIISDMGRPPDPQAGYTLLKILRSLGKQAPFFIYAGSRAREHVEEALRRGAQGTTNRPSELIEMVLTGLGAPHSVDRH